MKKEISDMAKNLGNRIKESDEFKKFKLIKEQMDSDEDLVSLKKLFDDKKEQLNSEISKDDYDRDKVKKISDDLRSIYEKINNVSCVLEHEEAKEKLNTLINEVNSIMYETIYGSSNIFGDKCDGSCESCTGCF